MKKPLLRYKIIYLLLTIFYGCLIIVDINSFLGLLSSFGFKKAIQYVNLLYDLIIITMFFLCLYRFLISIFASFFIGIYLLLFLPITGIKSFSMSWYAVVSGNLITAIFYCSCYMLPIISAIGLIIWYLDKNKNNKATR